MGKPSRRRAATLFAIIAGCYAGLAVTLIGSGLLFTHFLLHGPVGRWDDHVNSWFAGHRTPTWTDLSAAFSLVADTLGVIVVAVLVTVVLLVRRSARLALLLLVAMSTELAVFLSTTYLVARPRPAVPRVGSTPSTFSWPSGHVAATVVLYGGIAVLIMIATPRILPRLIAWTFAAMLTLAVALSRVYRGEHHPTDTLAGLALGLGALYAGVLVLRSVAGHHRAASSREGHR